MNGSPVSAFTRSNPNLINILGLPHPFLYDFVYEFFI